MDVIYAPQVMGGNLVALEKVAVIADDPDVYTTKLLQ